MSSYTVYIENTSIYVLILKPYPTKVPLEET